MLRSKSGYIDFKVVDKKTHQAIPVNLNNYLTPKQKRVMSSKPDLIWQMAQHIKNQFAKNDLDIAVYATCRISVNGRPYQQLIDDKVDLANADWNYFKHSPWILPSKLD